MFHNEKIFGKIKLKMFLQNFEHLTNFSNKIKTFALKVTKKHL
jgi:hypothetical protein